MDMSSGQSKLVDKNIIKSENSTFGSTEAKPSRLSSSEKTRTKEATDIFVGRFFDEQKKRAPDTRAQTQVSKLPKSTPKPVALAASGGGSGSSGSGLLASLLGLLGLAGLAKYLNPSALKQLLMSGIKKIWTKLKGAIDKLWKGIKGLAGKLWNGVKWGWNKTKSVMSKAWGKIKGVFGYLKNKIVGIFKSIGNKIAGLWGKVTGSKAYKAFTGIIDDAISAIGKFFLGIKNKIASVVSAALKGVQSLLPGGVKGAATATGAGASAGASKGVGKSAIDWLWNTGKAGIGKVGGAAKAVGTGAVNMAKAAGTGVVQGAKVVGSAAKAVGEKAFSMTAGAAKSTLTAATSKVLKGAGGVGKLLGKLAKRVPFIGTIIESFMTKGDLDELRGRYEAGEITEQQLQQLSGRRIIQGVGGVIGTASVGTLGAALGTVVAGPGIGSFIGAVTGGILGDQGGKFLGGLITDYLIPEKYIKSIGAYVTGTNPPADEMQDFILKGGQLHKFNSRDEVMGLKQGGAINEFLRGGGSSEGLKFLAQAQHKSNQYLQNIAQNTAMMVQGLRSMGSGGGNSIAVSNTSPQPGDPLISLSDNRAGYLNSPYSLA